MSNWEQLFIYWSTPGIIGAAICMLTSGEWKFTIWTVLYCLLFGIIFGGLAAICGLFAIPMWFADSEKAQEWFNRNFIK